MALHVTLRKCIVSRVPTLLECKPYFISRGCYSTDTESFRVIDKPNLAHISRGTGYRSSFNGIVCTVFGTTGFIGGHFVHRLGRTGTQIIVAYRGAQYDAAPVKIAGDLGQILFTPFYLRDEESIRKAVKYSDVVVNCVGQDCDSWNFKLEEVHIDGPRRMARICREMGVKKFIHISSMGVSPNPKTIIVPGGSRWIKSKWHGEQAVREEFPDAIIVRPSEVFGEEDRFLNYYGVNQRLWERTLYLHERGDTTIKQPVYVEDVCEGLTELVLRPAREVNGKTYQFVGPRRFYLGDLCDYLYKIMWKDEEWGYQRCDSRLSLEFNVMLRLRNIFYLVKPGLGIHIERFEREHTTDTLDKNLPTLEDLGVQLNSIDKYVISLLRQYNAYQDYCDDVLERIFPDLPPPADK